LSDTPHVRTIAGIDMAFEPADWPFAATSAEAIAAHWRGLVADKPRLFDGEILLQYDWRIEKGLYRSRYLAARYSAFLAWRDFGFPGQPMRNGFAMAALRAADGAFLLGEMGPHTANPGRVYFAAGTPDRDDIRDGKVDLAGSVTRELFEETGLTALDVRVEDSWVLVEDGPRAAFMRPVRIDRPASEARDLMLTRMRGLEDDELSDIVIVRRREDLDPARMPAFMIAYLDWALSSPGQVEG
jgi:8-oxo-dGTP pyrophosphatase MutT (NUDIX family)